VTKRLAAMQLAKAEAEDYLRSALQILGEAPDENATPARLDRAHGLVTSYVQLAGVAVDRFQEAAHGA